MAERLLPRLRGQDGTTLAELLVVIVLLGVIGGVTTTGIVQGFNAQQDANSISESLSGTRLAVQRVRDFARGADEVCASSTATSLVLWTDDNGDGAQTEDELDIFEQITDGGQDLFQRRVPVTGSDDTVQLIRDDIINVALFGYSSDPSAQPADLVCTDGVTPSGASPRVRTVDVSFQVENPSPDPLAPDLETSTTVRLRNAGLADGPQNVAPQALFTVECTTTDAPCVFDASGSSDTDGLVVEWDWELISLGGLPLATASGELVFYSFLLPGNYDVTLTVTDDEGATDEFTTTATVLPAGANVPPTADFTFDCLGTICDFTSTSFDDDGIDDWSWDLGGVAASGDEAQRTFPTAGDYDVTLTVRDTDGQTASLTKKVSVGSSVVFVDRFDAQATPSNGSNNNVTVNVRLARTTAGSVPASTISVSISGSKSLGSTGSCATTNGTCTVTFTGVKDNQMPATVKLDSVTPPAGTAYEPGQNTVATSASVN